MQDTVGGGEGRRTKRKDLIWAQEPDIKTGNVNSAKDTKQNKNWKKSMGSGVSWHIINPSVEEINYFVC